VCKCRFKRLLNVICIDSPQASWVHLGARCYATATAASLRTCHGPKSIALCTQSDTYTKCIEQVGATHEEMDNVVKVRSEVRFLSDNAKIYHLGMNDLILCMQNGTFCAFAQLHTDQEQSESVMSALGAISGRTLSVNASVHRDRALLRPQAHARQRRRPGVRCAGSEQGSAPEDLGGGDGGAAQQTPKVQDPPKSDTPQLQAPSTVTGPRGAGQEKEAVKGSSQLGENAGVREDAPGSSPELDGAAEAQATPKAQGSGAKQRRKVDT
jgi:hypothetical protein